MKTKYTTLIAFMTLACLAPTAQATKPTPFTEPSIMTLKLGTPVSTFFALKAVQKAKEMEDLGGGRARPAAEFKKQYEELIADIKKPGNEEFYLQNFRAAENYGVSFTPGTATLLGLAVSGMSVRSEWDAQKKEFVLCSVTVHFDLEEGTNPEKTAQLVKEALEDQMGPCSKTSTGLRWDARGESGAILDMMPESSQIILRIESEIFRDSLRKYKTKLAKEREATKPAQKVSGQLE